MALNKFPLSNCRGVTLIELLIGSILLSLVIGAAAAVYLSGARFLGTVRTASQNYQAPNLKTITRYIDIGNAAAVTGGGKRLTITCDCDMETLTSQNGSTYSAADDETALFIINNGQATLTRTLNGGTPETLFTNVDGTNSSFTQISNGVIEMTLTLTSPAQAFTTRASLVGATG